MTTILILMLTLPSQIFDEDRATSESLGQVTLPMTAIITSPSTTAWHAIEPAKNKGIGQGELHIKVSLGSHLLAHKSFID
jgi:hypothetical protein